MDRTNHELVNTNENMTSEVSRILWEIWDPIGVNDTPEAEGEYDSYVQGVVGMLIRDASDVEIREHLGQIEVQNMGFSGANQENLNHVIAALRKINMSGE